MGICVLLLFSCENRMEEKNPLRKIRRQIAEHYSFENCYNSDEGVLVSVEETHFDTCGRPTKKTTFAVKKSGAKRTVEMTEFNSSGLQLHVTELSSEGDTVRLDLYSYTAEGKTVKTINYRVDGSTYQRVRKFNTDDVLLEKISLDSDGGVTKQILNHLDVNGNVISRQFIDFTSDSISDRTQEFEYEYDSAGRILSETRFRTDGSERYKYTAEYDSAGQLISSTERISNPDADSLSSRMYHDEYQYDVNGVLIRKTRHDSTGNGIFQHEYSYDDRGNRTSKHILKDSLQLIQQIYKYNNADSLIEYAMLEYPGGSMTHFEISEYNSENRPILKMKYYCYPDSVLVGNGLGKGRKLRSDSGHVTRIPMDKTVYRYEYY